MRTLVCLSAVFAGCFSCDAHDGPSCDTVSLETTNYEALDMDLASLRSWHRISDQHRLDHVGCCQRYACSEHTQVHV